VWWSRILPYGVAYLLFCIPLVVLYMSIVMTSNNYYDGFFRFFLCNEPEAFHWQMSSEQWENAVWWRGLYVSVTLFAAIFCIGQMISLFVRSFLTAIPVVTAMFCGLFFWVMIVKYLLGYGGLFWAVWPMLIACLVASRLRTANWQRGRNGRRGWRTPLLTLSMPTLLILCVIPVVRVYSVPVIYLGYDVVSDMMMRKDYDMNYYVTVDDAGHFRLDHAPPGGAEYIVNRDKENPYDDFPDYIGNAFLRNHAFGGLARSNYHVRYQDSLSAIYWYIECCITDNPNSETLRQLIAVLEQVPKTRPPLREGVARNYITGYRALRYEPSWLSRIMPWEKYRAMRRLDYEYQVLSQIVDEVEQFVYHNQGNIDMIRRNGRVVANTRSKQYNEVLPDRSGLIEESYWDRSGIYTVVEYETRHRATIIQLALQVYYLEHGALPETLAELEGVYLKKLPTVPITGEAFEYHPEFQYFMDDIHPPYIYVPNHAYGRGFDTGFSRFYLDFMKEKPPALVPLRDKLLPAGRDSSVAARPPCR
ncbi:MAG: hypothetical protein FWD31_07360, partial [Planctomycetaceae bacterium]|nr:hypothetical protein [Planctomycetaceae bacterium]